MPSSADILAGLRAVATDWQAVAIAWHVAVAAFLASLFLGWRPGRRQAGILLAAPLASVSVLGWLAGDPFNGAVFAAITVALVAVALGLPSAPVSVGPPWAVMAGGFLTAFGWAYPHFLEGASWVTYLYAAPLGLIPCPTLSGVVGVALVADGLGSRAWALIVAAGAVGYGLIGAFRLGVVIDAILLAGAIFLALVVMVRRGRVGATLMGGPEVQ